MRVRSVSRAKADTTPGGVGLHKKTEDLSASEREKCEYGEDRDVLLCCSQIQYIHMVAQKQSRDRWGLIFAKNQRT